MSKIELLIVQIPIVILAITIHEFSHAFVAYKLGDDTAKRVGRLSLNPIKHLDILGAIMLLVVRIGWAKPVPINPYNFNNMKIGTALTAAAGPASNFIIAILAAILFNTGVQVFQSVPVYFSYSFQILLLALRFAVMINIALGLFNLIPIPPLDGSKIIGGFMPDDMFFKWSSFERKGAIFLMIFFAVNYVFRLGLLEKLIYTPLDIITKWLIYIP